MSNYTRCLDARTTRQLAVHGISHAQLQHLFTIGIWYTENMTGDLSGFREVEHMADWQLEVWAQDVPGLLEQAARGMYALAGVELHTGPRVIEQFELQAGDTEELLVRFLGELLFKIEQAGEGFDGFHFEFENERVQVRMSGGRVKRLDKEIKAVTYHNLAVQQEHDRLLASIVFDV